MECHFCSNACIVDKDEKKILFIHHKKLNKWLFPGGHIEENEDPETAALREVKEETNLEVELYGERYPRQVDFIKPFAFQRNVIKEDHIHMDIYYIAFLKGDNNLVANETEVKGAKWFTKQDIMSDDFDTFPEKRVMALDILNMFE